MSNTKQTPSTWRDPWAYAQAVGYLALAAALLRAHGPATWCKLWEAVSGQTAAAWVQAVGSLVAIGIAVWVSRQQHNSAMRAVKRQGELQAHQAGLVVLELLKAVVDRVATTNLKLETLAKLKQRARLGERAFEVRETATLIRALEAVQLQLLPPQLVIIVMSSTSTLRQHTDNVQEAFVRAAHETEVFFQQFKELQEAALGDARKDLAQAKALAPKLEEN